MADMTEEEMEQKKGLLRESEPDHNARNEGKRFEIPHGANVKTLPDTVDWAKSGMRPLINKLTNKNQTNHEDYS